MIGNPEKILLDCFKERKAIETKNIVIYTAGYTGLDFFDLSKLTLSPKTSEKVIEMYMDLLNEVKKADIGFNKLAFIDRTIGPMAIASQLSLKTNMEILVIKTRIPCSCNLCTSRLKIKGSIYPPVSKGDKVVIVSDVVTTGGTILGAINIIKKNGAKVVAAVAILDRQIEAEGKTVKENLEEKGVRLFSSITRDRFLAWGFTEPSEDDLKEKDFFSLLKEAVFIKYGTTELGRSLGEIIDSGKNFFDFIAEDIIDKKDIEKSKENKRVIRNMFLSLLMLARTKSVLVSR